MSFLPSEFTAHTNVAIRVLFILYIVIKLAPRKTTLNLLQPRKPPGYTKCINS